MISINSLSKKYSDKTILDNINYSFPDKGITVIVGINGCGKTTFLNIISNLLQQDNGTVYIDNWSKEEKCAKESMFYIPSDFYLPEYMTGLEYCHFLLSRYKTKNMEILNCLIELLDLENKKNDLIETYSFGMKKKIQIALAIACNTKYLILDEIFNGLDFEMTILLQDILQLLSCEKGIILVSHDLNTIEKFPDNILLMENGTLKKYNNSPQKLFNYIK